MRSISGGDKTNEYSDFSADIMKKISPFEIKVTRNNVFPLKIYKSHYLRKALDSITISKKSRKCLKKLFKVEELRKAFLYLFWIFIAFKF
jgi:hypothetical protein